MSLIHVWRVLKVSDPLEGKTLEFILNELVDKIGFEELGTRVNIRCFNNDPSIKSSLKFLRKTPWARAKIEDLYLYEILDIFD